MSLRSTLRSIASTLFRRSRVEAEMDEELRAHILSRRDHLERGGMSRAGAERQARVEFGGGERYKEECREVLGTRWLEAFFRELRFALRMLRRSPGFTAAAVLTLALGVGANLAIFAVFQAVMLRPLPYAHAERLVILHHRDQETGVQKQFIAIGDFVDLAARQSSFEALSGYGTEQANVYEPGETYRVSALRGSADLLQTLGVRPVLGRDLQPEDTRKGAPPVALISYDLWKQRFGGDSNVVGRGIKIAQDRVQIVGVMPRGFRFPPSEKNDLLLPMSLPLQAPAARKSDWTFGVARLKPGVDLASANANLSTLSQQLAAEYPRSNQNSEYIALAVRDALVGDTKPMLELLLGAVCVVLLIAFVNVSNLLLARLLGRRRELAVRLALGGSRSRIALQLLAESFLLAILASTLAILFESWSVRGLLSLVPKAVDAPGLNDVHLNGWVLLFGLFLTAAATLLFSLVSTLMIHTRDVHPALVSGSRSTGSPLVRRAALGLVVGEVALAIVLLVAGGLILRSFAHLMAVDPGFGTDNVATLEIMIPEEHYKDTAASRPFYDRVFTVLRALPKAQEVGAAVVVPLTGNHWTEGFERPEFPVPAGQRPNEVGWQLASGGFFRALRIPLRSGRLFNDGDIPNGKPVVIVSEALERAYFPGESAVGRAVKVEKTEMEIVGVVGDIRRADLHDAPRPDMYFPFEMRAPNQITLFVRTDGDAPAITETMKSALRAIEPAISFGEAGTMAAVAEESLKLTQLAMLLLGFFAVTALALAAIGIYGVISYGVRQRTREIGIRIALGAGHGTVFGMVLCQGVWLAGLGVALGVAGAFAATRLMARFLFGVRATDPLTFAAVAVLLVGVVLIACCLPARRAMKVDPVAALRQD